MDPAHQPSPPSCIANSGVPRLNYSGALGCNQLMRKGIIEPIEFYLLRMICQAFVMPASLGTIYACGQTLESVLLAQKYKTDTAGVSPSNIPVKGDSEPGLPHITPYDPEVLRNLLETTGFGEVLRAADRHAMSWWELRVNSGATAIEADGAKGQHLVWMRLQVASFLSLKDTDLGTYMMIVHGTAPSNTIRIGERMATRSANDITYSLENGPFFQYFDLVWRSFKALMAAHTGAIDTAALVHMTINSIMSFVAANASQAVNSTSKPLLREDKTSYRYGLTADAVLAPVLDHAGIERCTALLASEKCTPTMCAVVGISKLSTRQELDRSPHLLKFEKGRTAAELACPVEAFASVWLGNLRTAQFGPSMASKKPSFLRPLENGPVSKAVAWVIRQPDTMQWVRAGCTGAHPYPMKMDNNDLLTLTNNMTATERVLLGYMQRSEEPSVTTDMLQQRYRELSEGLPATSELFDSSHSRAARKQRSNPADDSSDSGAPRKVVRRRKTSAVVAEVSPLMATSMHVSASAEAVQQYEEFAPPSVDPKQFSTMAIDAHRLQSPGSCMQVMNYIEVARENQARLRLLEHSLHTDMNFRSVCGMSAFYDMIESGSPFASLASCKVAMTQFHDTLRLFAPEEVVTVIVKTLTDIQSLQTLFYVSKMPNSAAYIGRAPFSFPSVPMRITDTQIRDVNYLINEGVLCENIDAADLRRALLEDSKRTTDAVILVRVFDAMSPGADETDSRRQLLVAIWPVIAYAWTRICYTWIAQWPRMVNYRQQHSQILPSHVNEQVQRWLTLDETRKQRTNVYTPMMERVASADEDEIIFDDPVAPPTMLTHLVPNRMAPLCVPNPTHQALGYLMAERQNPFLNVGVPVFATPITDTMTSKRAAEIALAAMM